MLLASTAYICAQERIDNNVSVPVIYKDLKEDLPSVIEAELTRKHMNMTTKRNSESYWETSWPTFNEFVVKSDFYRSLLEDQEDTYTSATATIYKFLYKHHPQVQSIVFEGEIDEQRYFPVRITRPIKLYDLDSFRLKENQLPKVFYVDHSAYDASFEILDYRPMNDFERRMSKKDLNLFVRMECNQPVDVQMGGGRKDYNQTTNAEFLIYRRSIHNIGHKVRMTQNMTTCEVRISEKPGAPEIYGFTITTDTLSERMKLSGRVRNLCIYDADDEYQFEKGIARNTSILFNSMTYNNMSCQEKVLAGTDISFLNDPIEGINSKVEALTGTTLPKEVIENQDIEYEIEMVNAPQLDYILISTLEFKSDYYGNLIAKLLLWHARQGAKVKIILPGISYFLKPKDKILLDGLQQASANIEVQYFTFNRLSINYLHRVIHSKLFITLSNHNPHSNRLITGGRNIKDSFVFYDEVPDYRSRPDWVQYGGEESYIYYWDLETVIRGGETPVQVATQFHGVWNRDFKTHHYRPSILHIPGQSVSSENEEDTKIRHLLSIPYVDNRQMEALFTDLFKSARKSIKMISPYFRLTKELRNALNDAIKRGVKVDLITRLKLVGDNTPAISEDVNKKGVNEFYKKMNIYEWTDPKSILHVKAILVDDNLLYTGATNLNERSFSHDIESGLVIKGPESSFEVFNEIFENVYKPRTVKIVEKQKLRFFSRLIIPVLGSFF